MTSTAKRVAVLGSNGFLGRSLETWISDSGLTTQYKFYGLCRSAQGNARTGAFEYCEGNAGNESDLASFLNYCRPNLVLNLIGVFRASTFADIYTVNVDFPRRLMEHVQSADYRIEKMVLLGSAAEYGRPTTDPIDECAPLAPISLYGLTKQFQTELAAYVYRTTKLPVVVARLFNVLGPGQSPSLAMGNFYEKIDRCQLGETLTFGDLGLIRDYLTPTQTSAHLWQTLVNGQPGEVYNICSGRPTAMRTIVQDLLRASGKSVTIEENTQPGQAPPITKVVGDNSKLLSLYK